MCYNFSMKENLTPQDFGDRKAWEETFNTMEKQGSVGTTQSLDYKDALWYKENVETFKKEKFPEGSIVENYDDLIFDFDGVLYDSTKPAYLAAKLALEKFAPTNTHAHLSYEDVANSYHSPFQDYYKRFGIVFDTPEKAKEFQDYYQQVIYPQVKKEVGEPKFYDDALITLEKLREEKVKNPNLKVHLVSAGKEDYIREKLNEIGYLDVFTDMHLSAGDKKKSIAEIVEKSKSKERSVMIGDSPSDIKDAHSNQGVRSIAVARGQRETERLEHFLPSYVVNNLEEIFDLKSYAKELAEKDK